MLGKEGLNARGGGGGRGRHWGFTFSVMRNRCMILEQGVTQTCHFLEGSPSLSSRWWGLRPPARGLGVALVFTHPQ